MDFRVLLVQSIALLYWESTLKSKGVDSKELVQRIVKDMPSTDSIIGTDEDKENLANLRSICLSMASEKETMDREFLINKLKVSIKKDPELRQDVIDALGGEEENEEIAMRRVGSLQRDLAIYMNQKQIKDEIRKIASKTIFAGAPNFDVSQLAKEIIGTMERFVNTITNDDDDPVLNAKGSTSDPEELAKHFMNVQEDLSPDSVLKTGWQALNRMCGEVGGLRRGNLYVVGAMPNKGKSYVSSCIMLHLGLYNTPYMFDQTKKPCIIHISTENDLLLNLKIWYRYLWENEYNQPCDLQNTDPHAMSQWFIERLRKNGYEYRFFRIDPTNTSYHDIINRLMRVESEGYEIHALVIDYLSMINGDGLGDENRAYWIRQLFKVLRNFTNPRRITAIVPHQIATNAAELLRQGTDDFVKQIAGKRYWDQCRSIDMEVDFELLLNTEKDGSGNSWMAFGRGKDRTSLTTPEKDKFFFLPFANIGGLRPDIEGHDTSKRSIRGNDTLVLADDWRQEGSSGDEF